MIAKAIKKILRLVGTRLPSKEAMPREKAISVAVGIPQPWIKPERALKEIKINAGTIIPPKAAPKGRMAFLNPESSPTVNSLFISIPANKKKIAIKKSLIHFNAEWGSEICRP